jgi:hypothetical protein
MSPKRGSAAILALPALLACGPGASAADVEVAPFAGVQFAGSFSAPLGGVYSSGAGLVYGGTVDVEFAPGWRVEALFSRQEARLANSFLGSSFEMAIERYMAGIEEEHEYNRGRTRFFGVGLLGVTRFAPGRNGRDDDFKFTIGATLGVKHALSPRLGLRAEGRGFFVVSDSSAGGVCAGGCVFVYAGSGEWQGDLTAGLYLRF